MPIIFSAAIMAGAAAFASLNHADLAKHVEPSTLPTIIVDSRFHACTTEEKNYFFP